MRLYIRWLACAIIIIQYVRVSKYHILHLNVSNFYLSVILKAGSKKSIMKLVITVCKSGQCI